MGCGGLLRVYSTGADPCPGALQEDLAGNMEAAAKV